jgi:hypothetical protein
MVRMRNPVVQNYFETTRVERDEEVQHSAQRPAETFAE